VKYWPQAVLSRGEPGIAQCWDRKRDDPILFIAGSGFDPRAPCVLRRLAALTDRRIDLVLIEVPEDATDLAVRPRSEQNRRLLTEHAETTGGSVTVQAVAQLEDPRSLGPVISRAFQSSGIVEAYREVVIDVSAMPRSMFFPLVRGMLEREHLDPQSDRYWPGDLHVAVCENPEADSSILESGTSEAAAIGGFRAAPAEAEGQSTTIWVPVLGEQQVIRVERLNRELAYDEICPVLPSPSEEPRRADRLFLEYRRLLIEEIEIEPRNIIYAHERNPFDLYRTIDRLHGQYQRALERLGPVSMILSSHSSKLLSVGVLLAAYEHGLEVQHVGPTLYSLQEDTDIDALRDFDEIYDIWLTGEPYEP
jgi:hypothetical protein